MQRVLPSGEIASAAPQPIPRLRLPDRQSVFAQRADRLRQLSANSTMGGYLRLAAALADAQHAALLSLPPGRPRIESIAVAHEHRMPVIPAAGADLPAHWPEVLMQMCAAAEIAPGVPPAGPVFGAVQGLILIAFLLAGWLAVKTGRGIG